MGTCAKHSRNLAHYTAINLKITFKPRAHWGINTEQRYVQGAAKKNDPTRKT